MKLNKNISEFYKLLAKLLNFVKSKAGENYSGVVIENMQRKIKIIKDTEYELIFHEAGKKLLKYNKHITSKNANFFIDQSKTVVNEDKTVSEMINAIYEIYQTLQHDEIECVWNILNNMLLYYIAVLQTE